MFSLEEYEGILELLERNKAQESLYEFVLQAWPQIEGETPFLDGWHIKTICEHLEAVTRGEIKKLLVNIPPRTAKTSLISIMWPAWIWASNPTVKFVYASYAQKISLDHSRHCRMLIESDWYQYRWGHIVQLSKDQATKGHFTNSALGHRIATSVTAGSTALGGHILVMDDPNNAKDGESEVTRDSTNDWVSRVWPSRLNPGKLGAHVLVQQRVHENDVSGYLMSKDDKWVKLILPMEFEPSRKSRTVVLPSTNGKVWEDPRTKEGELLWASAFDKNKIEERKGELGTYNYAGQYQQRPSPMEGGIIKSSWFKWWKEAKPPDILQVVQSWDTALEAKEMNSYSACTTWGLFNDSNNVSNIILLSLWRGRVEYPELREMAKRLYADYRDDGSIYLKADGKHVPDLVLVESKASGAPLVQDLSRAGISAFRFNPTKYGDKIERVRLVTHIIEAGRIWVPARPPDYTKLRTFANTLVELSILFPNSDSRDVIDTMTQVLIRLTSSGLLSHPSDNRNSFGMSDESSFRFY